MMRPYEEPEDAGEGYFASISDLMVGILFVFLLMLAVFATNYANEDKNKRIAELERRIADKEHEIEHLKKEISSLKQENARLRNGIAALVKQFDDVTFDLKRERDRLEGVRRDLLLTLQSDLDRRGVKVEVDPGQGILRLSSEGLFELNEDRFTPQGAKNARALLEEMAQLLPCYSKDATGTLNCATRQPIFETILIEGHTDTRPTDRAGANWTLSTDRARAFLELMTGPLASLRNLRNLESQPLLGLAGYGESRPRPDIDGTDERNRRIEIRFLLSGSRETLSDRLEKLDDLLANLRDLAKPMP
jgi:chemotaxis protein MotB